MSHLKRTLIVGTTLAALAAPAFAALDAPASAGFIDYANVTDLGQFMVNWNSEIENAAQWAIRPTTGCFPIVNSQDHYCITIWVWHNPKDANDNIMVGVVTFIDGRVIFEHCATLPGRSDARGCFNSLGANWIEKMNDKDKMWEATYTARTTWPSAPPNTLENVPAGKTTEK